MRLSVRDLIAMSHLEHVRIAGILEQYVTGVSTDSRTVSAGELFVALRGERFNGHDFVDQASERGALCAVVDQQGRTSIRSRIPLLVVSDTTVALGLIARHYRSQFHIPVLGIAGSNGKTTTKEMIAAVLGGKMSILKTEGNLNNQIGVPMTLFRLTASHEIAVIELGTNHPGELAYLCDIAEPTMGLITSIGKEHLEFFKTVDGVESEEAELFRCVANLAGATAFVNADDARIVRNIPSSAEVVRYGFGPDVNVRGKIERTNDSGGPVLAFEDTRTGQHASASLGIPGDHNALNALASVAVGLKFSIPVSSIVSALEGFRPASKRMEREVIQGVTILNDTYNANPDSMLASLKVLASANVAGKRIAVLGDMKELGDAGPSEHSRIGGMINDMKIDYVLGYGELTRHLIETIQGTFVVHYSQKNLMAEYLAELVSPGDIVLIKGSRSMKLEDVVIFLHERLRSTVAGRS